MAIDLHRIPREINAAVDSDRIAAVADVVEFLLVYFRKKLGPQDYAMMIEKIDFARRPARIEDGGSE